jgi:hypothetical protein
VEAVGFVDVLLRARGGQHEDRDRFQVFIGLDLHQHFTAILSRHVEVEKNQVRPGCVRVRPVSAKKLHRFHAVADHMDVAVLVGLLERFLGQKNV